MRRLANQTRDDVYASLRDYQELHSARSVEFAVSDDGPHSLAFVATPAESVDVESVGVGVYIKPSEAVSVSLALAAGAYSTCRDFQLSGDFWNRLGVALDVESARHIDVTISWSGAVSLSVWGLSAGPLALPRVVLEAASGIEELNRTHLAPETYYLRHDEPVGIDVYDESSTAFTIEVGYEVTLKKCSYCQRLLPVDPDRLGILAFHKHNSKRTKHQNECRSCKKWRINDSFNPKRTVDQLHESSVITRERQIFLKDPERLQQIKLRTGAGLKSQVWERFGRKCFYCGKQLQLSEVQLDHTRPLAYLWPIDEHATCLCAEHNNQKSDRFPVDFYNEPKLHELAAITGLSYEALIAREINPVELARIRGDIVTFALEWEPRTFAATARKVAERMPHINLFEDLRLADEDLHRDIVQSLAARPAGVIE